MESVLPRLAEHPRYVRTRKELDWPALKSDREKGLLTDEQLQEFGLIYNAPTEDEITVHPQK